MWQWLKDVLAAPQAAGALAAAVVAAATSILVSLFTHIWNPFAARRLEKYKAELQAQMDQQRSLLQEQLERQKSDYQERIEGTKAQLADLNSARSARRDYEYEARKRLYDRVEPLLFQLYEAAEQAYFRVKSLARTARHGDLTGPDGWLSHNGYYLQSTVQRMLHPSAIFRLIQQQMTFIDLDLDESIKTKYYLLKLYVWSFTDDFIIARLTPELPYDPNHIEADKLVKRNPEVYRRQALVIGDLDNAMDALLIKGEAPRPLTFGEFEAALKPGAPTRGALQEAVDLYFGFSPDERPVLARMLLCQGCLAELIMESFHKPVDQNDLGRSLCAFVESNRFAQDFAWSASMSPEECNVVKTYILPRLNWIPTRWAQQ